MTVFQCFKMHELTGRALVACKNRCHHGHDVPTRIQDIGLSDVPNNGAVSVTGVREGDAMELVELYHALRAGIAE